MKSATPKIERRTKQDGIGKLLASALESTADGILVVDSNGRIRYYNRKFLQMWRVPPEILESHDDRAGLNWALSQLKEPERFLAGVRHLHRHQSEEGTDILEFKDGRVFERHTQPRLQGARTLGRVWSFRDVTRDIQLERMLAEAQRIARIGSWESDRINGRITWSDGLYRMLGLDPAREEMGPTLEYFLTFVHPEDREVISLIQADLKERKRFSREFRFVRRDGQIIDVQSEGEQIEDEDGRVLRVCGIVQDITAKKEAERDRLELLAKEKEARAEAERASREKDLFLATLSHELRTPLTSILMWAQMLRTGRLGKEETARAAKIIEQSAKTQSQLINDILDVSRIILGKLSMEKTEVDPSLVVQSAIELLRPAAQAKNILIEADLEQGNGFVMGDPMRLQQVICNLGTNAIKFSPSGSQVKFRVSHRLTETGKKVVISVTDHGIGMDPAFLPQLFNRFTQADNSTTRATGGLGLGLAIAQNLVKLHEGEIEVESEGPGKGANFRVILPLTVPSSSHPTMYELPLEGTDVMAEAVNLKGLRVLIVDDDETTRDACFTTLTSYGANVIPASTVKEAFQLLLRFKPDLLLADIAMPEEDGYALIRRVRALESEEGGKTPAIALTAFASVEARRRILNSGFNACLAKPVNVSQLVSVIQRLSEKMTDRAEEPAPARQVLN